MTADPARLRQQLVDGIARHRAGDLAGAAAQFQAVLDADPRHGKANDLMAVIRHAEGRSAEALTLSARAVAGSPLDPAAHFNRAGIALHLGEIAIALDAAEAAIALKADWAEAWNTLGIALTRLDRAAAAVAAFDRAVALAPERALFHANRAKPLDRLERPSEAHAAGREAVRLAPGDASAWFICGRAAAACGRPEQAVAALGEAIARAPQSRSAWDGLLHALFAVSDDPRQLAEVAANWGRIQPPPPPRPVRRRVQAGADPRLHLGLVSPDFRVHSVASLLDPVLAAWDRTRWRITLYAEQCTDAGDLVTARLRAGPDTWVATERLDDEALAARVVADGVDVLVDLAGHTDGNRLGLFARRPAPLQASWLGYPGRVGLATIDLRLTDPVVDPQDAADAGELPTTGERLLRLPVPFFAYAAPADAPLPSPRPTGAPLVLGSFCAIHKLGEATLDLWAAALAAVPRASLLLKARGFADPAVAADLRMRLVQRGIEAHRITLAGATRARADHLARYAEIDIALDSHPYAGTVTTCEALWMGVPVVTCVGRSHASRVSGAILTRLGLADLATTDRAGFVAAVVRLAADAPRRAALRATLRGHMQTSFGDGAAVAQAIAAAFERELGAMEQGRAGPGG